MIDSHAHLNHQDFAADLAAVLERTAAAGVETVLVPGYDLPSSRRAVALAEQHPQVFAAVGVHPHDAKTLDDSALHELTVLAKHPRVVAIGEIGLDFYRDLSPREVQKDAFARQIQLAREVGLPIIIHQREAEQQAREVFLAENAGEPWPGRLGGVWHCFSGGEELAAFAVQQGFCLGLAGPVTFPNSRKLADIAASLPAENLLLETDCPYLSPSPHRGRRNEPAHLPLIAQRLADLRGEGIVRAVQQTTENFHRVFLANRQ